MILYWLGRVKLWVKSTKECLFKKGKIPLAPSLVCSSFEQSGWMNGSKLAQKVEGNVGNKSDKIKSHPSAPRPGSKARDWLWGCRKSSTTTSTHIRLGLDQLCLGNVKEFECSVMCLSSIMYFDFKTLLFKKYKRNCCVLWCSLCSLSNVKDGYGDAKWLQRLFIIWADQCIPWYVVVCTWNNCRSSARESSSAALS
jgi:hypothetical protein